MNPLYEFNGSIYKIPTEDSECTRFGVEYEGEPPVSLFPYGGHCFYNDRNFILIICELWKFQRKKKKEIKRQSESDAKTKKGKEKRNLDEEADEGEGKKESLFGGCRQQ